MPIKLVIPYEKDYRVCHHHNDLCFADIKVGNSAPNWAVGELQYQPTSQEKYQKKKTSARLWRTLYRMISEVTLRPSCTLLGQHNVL